MRLIDANYLCKDLNKLLDHCDDQHKGFIFDYILPLIVGCPTVNEWIPCSDSAENPIYPNDDEFKLVTVETAESERFIDIDRYVNDDEQHFEDEYKWDNYGPIIFPIGERYHKVVAWMPLPEPYEDRPI